MSAVHRIGMGVAVIAALPMFLLLSPIIILVCILATPFIITFFVAAVVVVKVRFHWDTTYVVSGVLHFGFRILFSSVTALYRAFGPHAKPSAEMRALELCVKSIRPKAYSVLKFREAVEGYRILFFEPHDPQDRPVYANGVPCVHIPYRCLQPTVEGPVLFYIHGGAFIAGSPQIYRGMVAPIGRKCGCSVIAVQYRLSPEYPFPAGIHDAVNAYRWLVIDKGVDPNRVVFMGDSAGGSLCLLACCKAAEEGLPSPAGAVTMSPYVDLTTSTDSWRRNRNTDFILCDKLIDARIAPSVMIATGKPEDYSPYFFSQQKLQTLPPLYVTVSSAEPLVDEVEGFVTAAQRAGVDVHFEKEELLPHVYPSFYRYCPESQRSMDGIVDWITKKVAVETDE